MDADPAVGDVCVSATAARHDDRSVLRAAVSSPLQATGLGLTARVERSDPSTESGIWLVIRVEPQAVTLQREGDRWIGAVDVFIAQGLPGA